MPILAVASARQVLSWNICGVCSATTGQRTDSEGGNRLQTAHPDDVVVRVGVRDEVEYQASDGLVDLRAVIDDVNHATRRYRNRTGILAARSGGTREVRGCRPSAVVGIVLGNCRLPAVSERQTFRYLGANRVIL